MNLHISHDNIFMDYIIPIAREVDPGNNKFIFFSYDRTAELKHVKSKDVGYFEYGSDMFWKAVGDINSYRNIYVHWLEGLTTDFVAKIPKGINVIWCFWGGDGLEIPELKESNYQPSTLAYYREKSKNKIRSVKDFKKVYHQRLKNQLHIKAIRRVDYFAHYLEKDYNLIKEATGMKSTFIPFHYAAVEDIVPINEETGPKGLDILLGNSDTLSNNHFEAIDILSKINLRSSKVFCPLSYEKGKYARDVKAYGEKELGERFIPIMDFIAKDKYDQMLSRINSAIMNHNRSQALGNIMVLLWKGAKLFMNEKNYIFQLLSENGCVIYPLSQMTKDELQTSLDENSIMNNREVLMKLFSKQHQKGKIRKMLTI